MNLVVGVADLKISTDRADTIITYSLGSCLGVVLFDDVAGVGGMLHCMLPLSKIDANKASANPFMFVDSGMTTFLQQLFNLGAQRKSITAKVAGGSHILDTQGTFNIGERNYTVLRKILWKNDILIAAEDVGGSVPRTMSLNMNNGQTRLKVQGKEWAL